MFTPDGSSHFQGRSLEREQRGVETSGWNTRLNWEDSNEEQFVHDLGKTKRAVFTVTSAFPRERPWHTVPSPGATFLVTVLLSDDCI
ncbi:uncharacterized protein [Bos taurus]|uniref:uncharacterized protein isoform X3 n=1 Tax=Bos taurus TaxID=9913 RepID=UPI000D53ACE7|nr:uncharacterized protein LOC100847782 isoform X3 [Bos taurus]